MAENDFPDRIPIPVFDRRRLLRDGALLTGGAAGLAITGHAHAAGHPWTRLVPSVAQDSLDTYDPVALNATELPTLKAAIDRLIPSDDLGPSASEAGVFVAIDKALSNRNAATLPVYQAGLAALDKAAGAGGFAALAADKQDELLTQAESGSLADAPAAFFPVLLEHTRQGMFGDPVRGGNKDFAGWDLIGFPGIKLLWTEADQQIDAVVTAEHKSVADYGGDAL